MSFFRESDVRVLGQFWTDMAYWTDYYPYLFGPTMVFIKTDITISVQPKPYLLAFSIGRIS